jgi:hypothetical protein
MAKKKASKKTSAKTTKKQTETVHIGGCCQSFPIVPTETLSAFGKWVVRSWNKFYSLLRNGK